MKINDFRNRMISTLNSDKWKKHGNIKIKSNNIINVNKETSINASNLLIKNSVIDKFASRITNQNLRGLAADELISYKQRLRYYRTMLRYPSISRAVDLCTNELFSLDEDNNVVKFGFTKLGEINIPNNIKEELSLLFVNIFNTIYDLSRNFVKDLKIYYTEGELYYEKTLDRDGNLSKTRRIENELIRPVTWNNEIIFYIEITSIEGLNDEDTYYSEQEIEKLIQMKVDAIISGSAYDSLGSYNEFIKFHNPEKITHLRYHENLNNEKNDTISYLEGIAPIYNRLAMMEESLVGYRLTRSLTSYVINVDMAGIESYEEREVLLQKYIDQHDTEMVYDPANDSVNTVKDVQTINRIFWFSSGEPFGKSTVEALDLKADFDAISDIKYFEKKFIEALKVPLHRFISEEGSKRQNAIIDNGILNEEMEFQKFLDKTRYAFINDFFLDIFQTVLIEKGYTNNIINKNNFIIEWNNDNFYKLHIKKTVLDTKSQMLNTMKGILPENMLYKDVFGYDTFTFNNILKEKIKSNKYKLNQLMSDSTEEFTDLDYNKIYDMYINDNNDEKFESTLIRRNVKFNNIKDKYIKKAEQETIQSAIEYTKNLLEKIEEGYL